LWFSAHRRRFVSLIFKHFSFCMPSRLRCRRTCFQFTTGFYRDGWRANRMAERRAVFVWCSAFPDGFERKASVIFSPPSSGVFF
jgi:hypothetical protein